MNTMGRNKKYGSLYENIDKFCNLVDQSLLVFEEGFKNYLHHDMSALNGNIQTIVKLENESSTLRRELEKSLYSRRGFSNTHGDILRLLDLLYIIISALYNDIYQLEIETPNIPEELNADFLKLMQLSTSSVANTIPACKAFFTSPDTIPDLVRRVYFYHKEADRQAKALKRKVFHEFDRLKLSEKFHLRYFALHIEEIAQHAIKVSDQLSVMTIRSQSSRDLIVESRSLPIILSSAAFIVSLLCGFIILPGSGLKSAHGYAILMVAAATVLVLVIFLLVMIVRARNSKRRSDSRMLAQEDELLSNNRRISEMEAQIMKMENDHLQNLLDLKRKETTGVVEKISEQKGFIDSIYDILQKAELSKDDESRDALLHEAKTQLSLRRNLTGDQNDFYAQVEQLHKDFSVRLASRFPNLSAQERKLATLLRLEYSTKYIADVLNISPKSVEVERHRLRTKMGLERGQNLTEFIKNI